MSIAVILALWATTDGNARQLTPGEALRNARMTTNGMRLKARTAESLNPVPAYTAKADGANCYYVFNNGEGKGFVILSADDLAPAVLGYVENGDFDYDKAPENMKWWLSLYERNIGEAVRTQTPITRSSGKDHEITFNLINTAWSQDKPFNDKCPVMNGGKAVTGCVATAMAQVMNFHQWPDKGTGSHSYTTKTAGLKLSADFGATTYRWNDMLQDYNGGYTTEQADAVATLMYHCGVSIDMNYGTESSGAGDFYVLPALMTYFDYDKGMTYEDRIFYTDDEWEEMICTELAAGRPVIYGGRTDKNVGHSFICDGYAGNGLFHFNWGWGGFFDGNFLMTGTNALNPEGSGIGGGTAGDGYVNGQTCLTGMQKARENSEVKIRMVCEEGYTIEYGSTPVTRESRLTFKGGIYNKSIAPADITFGLMFKSTTGNDVYYKSIISGEVKVLYGLEDFNFYPDIIVKNGEYEVYPVFKPVDGSGDWEPVKIPAGMEIPKITITGDGPLMGLTGQAYVGENGDNTTTADNVRLHFSLTAYKDFEEQTIVGWIFTPEGGYSIGYLTPITLSLKAGETHDYTMSENLTEILQAGSTYVLMLYNYTLEQWLIPDYYGTVYFTVTDPSGIDATTKTDTESRVSVYGTTGVMLRKDVKAEEALNGLPEGMYIVGGKKVIKRK